MLLLTRNWIIYDVVCGFALPKELTWLGMCAKIRVYALSLDGCQYISGGQGAHVSYIHIAPYWFGKLV